MALRRTKDTCEPVAPRGHSKSQKATIENTVDTASKRRILIAEDSPVTQDLLQLILEQQGYTVDLVADGEQALAALDRHTYDVALMDFHLPKIDGLEVATNFRKNVNGRQRPRFVAITADVKGLLGHSANCENFDAIIPKPFDMEEVLKVVARECDVDEKTVSDMVDPDLEVQNIRESGHLPNQFEFLRWPEDFNSNLHSARSIHASLAGGNFDAIVINQPASIRDLSAIWMTKALHLLPVIDMTGTLGAYADLDASKISVAETDDVDKLVQTFHDHRAKLHADLIYTDDIGEKLIGRLYVNGGRLLPRYDSSSKTLVGYNITLDAHSTEKEVVELLKQGLVERKFFDRFHSCDRCGSSHFNVREECVECGSSHLEEEAYLHHFRCAYQGPESDFRQSDDLVCPKCRRELSHFSVDYDKPGSMLRCQDCDYATSEPSVGFVCMECGSHTNGDAIGTRDVYTYTISKKGINFVQAGRALLEGERGALRFGELPLPLIVAMNAELKSYEESKKPFSLLNISYQNVREIERSEGSRFFDQLRQFFVENLRQTISKEDLIVSGQNCDFVLLKNTTADAARNGLPDLLKETTASLSTDPGVHIDIFGPEEFV